MKNDLNGVEIFNLQLTPETASRKGYKYIEDIIYNVLAPTNARLDILQLVYEYGYRLGAPTHSKKPVYGLYAPLNKL